MSEPNQVAFTLHATAGGRDVTPATIGLALFNQFNGEVETFLAGNQRRSAMDEVRFELQEGSYKLLVTLPALVLAAVEPDLRKLQREDSLGEVEPKRAGVVKQWQQRARVTPGYRVAISSPADAFRPIRISNETEYHTPDEDDWVAVEKYVVGRVVDMGGTTSANVHLLNEDNGRRIVASSSEDFLRDQRENYLYRKVQVHVAAMENLKNGELKDIRLLAFVGKGPSYDEAELEAAIEKGTRAWAGILDSSAWVRGLRGSDDE